MAPPSLFRPSVALSQGGAGTSCPDLGPRVGFTRGPDGSQQLQVTAHHPMLPFPSSDSHGVWPHAPSVTEQGGERGPQQDVQSTWRDTEVGTVPLTWRRREGAGQGQCPRQEHPRLLRLIRNRHPSLLPPGPLLGQKLEDRTLH